MSTNQSRLLVAVVVSILAAACGGDSTTPPPPPPASTAATDEATTEAQPTPEETTEPEPTEEETTEPPVEETTEPVVEETTEPVVEETTVEGTTEPVAEGTSAPTGGSLPPGSTVTDDFADSMEPPVMDVPDDTPYSGYTLIFDDTGTVSVEVPNEWSDIDGRPFSDDAGREFFDVRASSDLDAFLTTWNTPGIIVTASSDAAQSMNEVAFLDDLQPGFASQCTYVGRSDYDDGLYHGQFDVFEQCGGTEAQYLVLAAVPNSRAFVIVVQVQVNAQRDLEALDRALATFLFQP